MTSSALKDSTPSMKRPTVSIVMRTKDVADIVGQTLSALYSQTFQNFDLLVVDSGSKDETLQIVSRYPSRVISIRPEDYYPGRVLNRALADTTGDIVVFLNSDVVMLRPDVLERLLAAFAEPKVMAAFARQLVRPEAHDWVIRDYIEAYPETGQAPVWQPYSLPLAAMRREAWQIQPFYTDAWGSEDTEWGVRARERGFAIAYVPEAIVMHSHNYTLRQLYGRRFIEGEADAFIYRNHDSIPGRLAASARSMANDIAFSLGRGHIDQALLSIPRRIVYHWAYYKGRTLGERRRVQNDPDSSLGQKTVLSRYAA
jgi:rhamnosyltransferase